MPNAYGSKHEEATLRTEPITEEEEEKLRKIASGSDLIGYEMKFWMNNEFMSFISKCLFRKN